MALIACNQWLVLPAPTPASQVEVTLQITPTREPPISAPIAQGGQVTATASSPVPALTLEAVPESAAGVSLEPFEMGEPAGCLSAEDQAARSQVDQMLAYAGSLANFSRSLSDRQASQVWNGYTRQYQTAGSGAVALDVTDVQNLYQVQNMMNALQVAGFVTWLREGQNLGGLQILAVPLVGELPAEWSPYVLAYWQSRDSLPEGDAAVLSALKLPPCAWMVQSGYAPEVGQEWWPEERTQVPDYASAAESYQAANGWEAAKIAERINWLGLSEPEGASTMCGPLSWAILNDAQAFPPGFGAWSKGPKMFWLADPRKDGRPWSLFPRDDYTVYRFSEALGKFDFQQWPLYPGDFLYTYSKDNGFDHMLVVTEIDSQGNVYSVTNLIRVYPSKKVTIERAVLYNTHDLSVGLFRNDWNVDGLNGRTGHDGFDVFRPAWMVKDIQQAPILYEVKPGDTFGLIAERWKIPALDIAQTNQRKLGDRLEVGENLIIPPRPDFEFALR